MANKKESAPKVSDSLEKLEAVVRWFDEQDQVDVQEGLVKVREGAALVKELRANLKEVENEFVELKKELETDEQV